MACKIPVPGLQASKTFIIPSLSLSVRAQPMSEDLTGAFSSGLLEGLAESPPLPFAQSSGSGNGELSNHWLGQELCAYQLQNPAWHVFACTWSLPLGNVVVLKHWNSPSMPVDVMHINVYSQWTSLKAYYSQLTWWKCLCFVFLTIHCNSISTIPAES